MSKVSREFCKRIWNELREFFMHCIDRGTKILRGKESKALITDVTELDIYKLLDTDRSE